MTNEIAQVLVSYLSSLPFKDKIGGFVRAATFENGDGEKLVKKTIPIDCNATVTQCNSGKFTDFVPDAKYKSIIYFEDLGTNKYNENNTADFCFETRLRLVCWINQKKIGNTACSISTAAVIAILKLLPLDKYTNSGIFNRIRISFDGELIKDKNIFSKYTYDESVIQYLMPPFDYFALNFTVKYCVNSSCTTTFVINPEDDC